MKNTPRNADYSAHHVYVLGYQAIKKLTPSLFLLLAVTLISSCGVFRKLKKEVRSMKEDSRVAGHITNLSGSSKNVHVFVWTAPNADEVVVVDHTQPNKNGLFVFLLPTGPDYFVGALKDENGNERYDAGEPIWIHGDPSPYPVGVGKAAPLMEVQLSRKTVIKPHTAQALRKARGGRRLIELKTGKNISVAMGDIADMNHPRFSAEMGEKGLWEPVTYLKTADPGVYFLRPYDSSKIPVLFVYGAGGSAQDWSYFFKHLDSKRYQPWFYQYPSGIRLAESARRLDIIVQSLHRRYGFNRLDVVAHSMGGLLARDYVLRGNRDKKSYLKNFITISTPWNGHSFAKLGVNYAPEAVPSWHDVQSGSPFIQGVLSKPMPIPHHLIYGNQSKRSAVLPKENDGAVSVVSMTDPRATSKAASVDAYHYDHTGILEASKVLQKVESYLSQP